MIFSRISSLVKIVLATATLLFSAIGLFGVSETANAASPGCYQVYGTTTGEETITTISDVTCPDEFNLAVTNGACYIAPVSVSNQGAVVGEYSSRDCESFDPGQYNEDCGSNCRKAEARSFSPLPAFTIVKEPCDDVDRSILGIPTWYKYLDGERDKTIFSDSEPGKCTPVLGRNADGEVDVMSFLPIGLAVLEAMMVIAGLAAVVMIFWGAFLYLVSQGESDKAASARKTVINAAIGLVIVMIAARVVSFIAERITG